MCVYIYIYRERERERERKIGSIAEVIARWVAPSGAAGLSAPRSDRRASNILWIVASTLK